MSEKKIPYKIYLEEKEMPTQWYNVRADMKKQTSTAFEPGNSKTDDRGGTGAMYSVMNWLKPGTR